MHIPGGCKKEEEAVELITLQILCLTEICLVYDFKPAS